MLTLDQINQAKATANPATSTPGGPAGMTPDQATAWITGSAPPAAAAAAPSYGTRVATDVSNNVNDAASKLSTLPANPSLGQEVGAGLNVAKNATSAVLAPLNEAPGFKQLGQFFQAIGKPISDTLMQNPTYADAATKLAGFFDKNPGVSDALATADNVLQIGGAKGAVEGGVGLARDTASTKAGIDAVHDSISGLIESENPAQVLKPKATPFGSPAPSSLVDQIKVSLAKNNIDPRLETSAQRLADPVSTYDDYAAQAKRATSDVKADPPLAKVGEHIGDAYDQVVNTRRAVGENMAQELEAVKDKPVDLGSSFTKFEEELNKNGLQYDGESRKFIPNGQSKLTSFDQDQIGSYVEELNKLGANPTAGEMDAFLSRVPREMDVAKASRNITDTTNAERLIKGNLADLRSSLVKQPGMEAYAKARSAYANLSDFLDEGSRHLGAKTQSGDYARDTSMAKSSAESILSGGKKDWLIKLEGLTGYPALDDATLAIQAMKDAGDARGLSLFKVLTGGGLPTPHGVLAKLAGWGAEKAADAVVGSPTEQTQAFLRSLRDGKSTGTSQTTPMTTKAGTRPKRSQSTPNANTSKTDMSQSLP